MSDSEDYPPHDSRSRNLTVGDLREANRQLGEMKERLAKAVDDAVTGTAESLAHEMRSKMFNLGPIEGGYFSSMSSDGAPMPPRTINISAKYVPDVEPDVFEPSDIWGLPVEYVDEPRPPHIELDWDTPCMGCGNLLREHPLNLRGEMDARLYPGRGVVHKLCALEEVEIVEIKSLPPSTGESHGEASTTSVTPEA